MKVVPVPPPVITATSPSTSKRLAGCKGDISGRTSAGSGSSKDIPDIEGEGKEEADIGRWKAVDQWCQQSKSGAKKLWASLLQGVAPMSDQVGESPRGLYRDTRLAMRVNPSGLMDCSAGHWAKKTTFRPFNGWLREKPFSIWVRHLCLYLLP